MNYTLTNKLSATVIAAALIAVSQPNIMASSHMDAPLITLDDAANTTDVYAFKTSREGTDYLVTALSVYPFETPGIGPNKFNFDDNVLYSIFVSSGDDVARGRPTYRYDFQFRTKFRNSETILQSYTADIENVGDEGQNLIQTYTVKRTDFRTGSRRFLGRGLVPPNNQGNVTRFYNEDDDGEMPAKAGVADPLALDRYTSQTICDLRLGHRAFAGQREDGFYADIQAVFDLLRFRSGGPSNSFDSQSGFNVHTIVLEIPISRVGGDMQVAGVYATTSRRKITILREGPNSGDPRTSSSFIQVGRQGNPLFCEALVALEDKDLYNRSQPVDDERLFAKYALSPELGMLAGAAEQTHRTDLKAIFIPDMIKVDLSTDPARLTGGHADDEGFSRLGIFGGDTLVSQIQDGFVEIGQGVVPGGWPNGRRFGDDVLDVAVSAILSDLRDPADFLGKLVVADGIDNVSENDSVYNKVFPYAGTPHNGRNYRANPNFINNSN